MRQDARMGFILETIYELLIDALFPEPKHRWLRFLLYIAPVILFVLLVAIVLLWAGAFHQ